MTRLSLWMAIAGGALLGACFPSFDQAADMDASDVVEVDTTSASDTGATAIDTGVDADDAAQDDTHDAGDAGTCESPSDCPAVAGPCRERACVDHACRTQNIEGACDDGDRCTIGDHCVSGSCVASPVVCTALDTCHARGVCDPGSGVCSNPTRPDDWSCDDDDPCTLSDVCVAGVCVGSGTPDDSVGDWTVALRGTNYDSVRWVEGAPDGSVVVAGTFRSPTLELGDSPGGTPVTLGLAEGCESAVFVARLDRYGRPVGAVVVASTDGQIDCEGGLAVSAANGVTLAGAWRGSFVSDLALPPDTPTSGIFVLRLNSTFESSWSVWGLPFPGGDVGELPVAMGADAAGHVVIGVSGSDSIGLHTNSAVETISLVGEDYS